MHRHMSHQTGATFATVSFQATELIKAFKQPRPAQAMNAQVPTFHAERKERRGGKRKHDQFMVGQEKWRASPSKCQYSGMAQNKNPMKENVENSAIGYAMEEKKRQVRKSEGRMGEGEGRGGCEMTGFRGYKRANCTLYAQNGHSLVNSEKGKQFRTRTALVLVFGLIGHWEAAFGYRT